MAGQFTREELYELVWTTPLSKLAGQFGVSDVAIAKRCRREGVPVPPRGYWAKVAAGKSVERPALSSEAPPRPMPEPKTKPASATGGQSSKRADAAPVEPEAVKPTAGPTARVHRRRWKDRLPKGDRLESFWCAIDSHERQYSWGVNWRPWEYNEESWSEHNWLTLVGTVRSKTRHPYRAIELRLSPTHIQRDEIRRDLDGIGNAWTTYGKKGRLFCSASLLVDAFYALCDEFRGGGFAEMVVEIRNLKRGRGVVSQVDFRAQLTDLSE